MAFSDDDEPSGTAGKPILNVLEHKDIDDVMLVVVRYFGGIKLGAGGLVRAYSTSAQKVMEDLPTQTNYALVAFLVGGDFSLEQPLKHWLSIRTGVIESVAYSDKITVKLKIRSVDQKNLTAFVAANGGHLVSEK